MASFVLGYGDDGSTTEPAKTADQNLYSALYAGDTWRLTRKITLNLGARLDLQGDWTERYNRIIVFNPTKPARLQRPSRHPGSKRRLRFSGHHYASEPHRLPLLEPCQPACRNVLSARSKYLGQNGLWHFLSPSRWPLERCAAQSLHQFAQHHLAYRAGRWSTHRRILFPILSREELLRPRAPIKHSSTCKAMAIQPPSEVIKRPMSSNGTSTSSANSPATRCLMLPMQGRRARICLCIARISTNCQCRICQPMRPK